MTMKLPNYLADLLKAIGRTPAKPGVHHITVLHDDWCDALAGKGVCNCNPIVRPGKPHK